MVSAKPAYATVQLRRVRRMPTPDDVIAALNGQLADYRPQVALYFSFAAVSRDFMYQVNMWIETLEWLDLRPLIVLRERPSFRFLSRTWIPVVCVPKADDVAKLDLSEVRVVLYPGNAGKNVHMLRIAEAKHVFIGHGDSDKLASSNRVSKVYDEIWVAGRAGRDRYQRVRHAISDKAIVEVGRPQLAPIRLHADHVPGPEPVVLYAPTWEGWSDDDCHTSLIPMGVTLVERLLAENVRVIYKPHPLTGKRSREAAEADAAIRELLRTDNERHGGAAAEAAIAAAQLRLKEIQTRLDELAGRLDGDDAQQTRDARVPARDGAAEWQALNDEWHRVFWESRSGVRHHIIRKRLPSLYECFNQADMLISDVSSVVADFVASLKPYVLTNAHDLPDEDFRAAYTTAGGAYLLDRDCTRLPEILRSVREPRHDPMAPHRRTLTVRARPGPPHLHGAVQRGGPRPGRAGRPGAGGGRRRGTARLLAGAVPSQRTDSRTSPSGPRSRPAPDGPHRPGRADRPGGPRRTGGPGRLSQTAPPRETAPPHRRNRCGGAERVRRSATWRRAASSDGRPFRGGCPPPAPQGRPAAFPWPSSPRRVPLPVS
ncbi:hypothetical protein SFUMM280S_00506 [Streptomyces fumanus]